MAFDMSIRVHNSEHFEELRQVALNGSNSPGRPSKSPNDQRESFGHPLGSAGSPNRSTATELSKETQMKRVAMKHELYLKEQEALQKKLADTIAENLQKQRTRKEAQYMKLRKDVEDGKALAEELHEKLHLQEQSKARQYQRMHEEWKSGVYHKLNDPILARIDAMGTKQLNLTKHENYQKFLDITNKKGGLFRDIIIESEYNPLHDVKYLSHRAIVDDPVKRVIRRREEEDAIAREGNNTANGTPELDRTSVVLSPSRGGGRNDNLDIQLWAKGVFESTPYGYFHKMMNSKPSTDSSKTYASRVNFDHYKIARGAAAVDAELPKGKRTEFDPTMVKIPQTTIQLN
ncbi:TPA: hypothetical protein N0F65_007818 [Lagenidium giganteum]|uniref:Uncharacterized protein n=1 Tax=Lagenidium giganteum TaxID=4803 RepID=A0AAV2YYQ2_9STRA|nr:TPA: hypothetical protein N0F65_007818 [Lagenidium giganteum]